MILFTFAWDPETKNSNYAGNTQPEMALALLQEYVIASKVKEATERKKEPVDERNTIH